MSERKVLNKYYPPDFDPEKIPRMKRTKEQMSYKVRMMAPFNMRCLECGNYIYRATKFNARKEDVRGENYLGIDIYRFYISCPRCLQQITFKTDPKNADYVIEHGATRNFEVWKQEEEKESKEKGKKTEEEMGNAMKVLENRTKQSKRDVAIMDALEDIKEWNAQLGKLSVDSILQSELDKQKKILRESTISMEEEDEALIAFVFNKKDKIIKSIESNDETKSINSKKRGNKKKIYEKLVVIKTQKTEIHEKKDDLLGIHYDSSTEDEVS